MTQDFNEWFTSTYRKEYNRLYYVAYRLTGSTETSKELVQDTFVWAFLRGERFMAHPKPEAWLMKTLTNLVKNENRRLSAQNVSLETQYSLSAPDADHGISELLPSKLSEEDREILIWRFEQELDYQEIAERLGISEAGSRGRVFRAVERCRKLLNGEEPHTYGKNQ